MRAQMIKEGVLWRIQVNYKENWLALCDLKGIIVQVNDSVLERHSGEHSVLSSVRNGVDLSSILLKREFPTTLVCNWMNGNETQRLIDERQRKILVRLGSMKESAVLVWIQLIRMEGKKRLNEICYSSSSEEEEDSVKKDGESSCDGYSTSTTTSSKSDDGQSSISRELRDVSIDKNS